MIYDIGGFCDFVISGFCDFILCAPLRFLALFAFKLRKRIKERKEDKEKSDLNFFDF
jgi:hypothetical protein